MKTVDKSYKVKASFTIKGEAFENYSEEQIHDKIKDTIKDTMVWFDNPDPSKSDCFMDEIVDCEVLIDVEEPTQLELQFDEKPMGAVIRINDTEKCLLRIGGIPKELVYQSEGKPKTVIDLMWGFEMKRGNE